MFSKNIQNNKNLLKYLEYFIILILYINLFLLIPKHTMWLDELDWGVGILIDNNNLKDVFLAPLKTGENLPLFYIPLYLVKCIFGYNETIFVATSIIVSFLGLLGVIKISREFFNDKIEFFSVIWICSSYLFTAHCALQVRPYCYLFTFSVWTIYFYLKRLKEENYANIIKYGISMIFLMHTHWFGILISLVYAFIDFILFINKKIKLKCILSYIIAGLVFLPSFIVLLMYHNGDVKEFGVEALTIITAKNTLLKIFNLLAINFIFISIAYVILFHNLIKKNKDNYYIKIIAFSALILLIGVFVFSKLYPPGNLIRARYFTEIIPHMALLFGWIFDFIIQKFRAQSKTNLNVVCIWIGIYLVFMIFINIIYLSMSPNAEMYCFYKDSSNYLSKQDDIYDKDTLVIHVYGKTWIDYYFTLQNKRLPANIICVNPLDYPNTLDSSEESLDYFKYFVKDGKKLKKPKDVESIFDYDIIYYVFEYRVLDDEILEELDKSYYKETISETNIVKYTKVDRSK